MAFGPTRFQSLHSNRGSNQSISADTGPFQEVAISVVPHPSVQTSQFVHEWTHVIY